MMPALESTLADERGCGMATDDQVVESVPVIDGVSESLAQRPTESEVVSVGVTYSRADARATMLMRLPRRTPLLVLAASVLSLLIVISTLAAGDPFPRTMLWVLGLAVLYILLYLVVLPWQIAKASTPGQSWVISRQGVHITLPGTDVKHEWSRFDEVVVRPAVVQFRIGKCSLSLPRRCVAEQDLETLTAFAVEGGVAVRKSGQFR